MRPIAALYVQKNGSYYGLEGVDPWDEERDARLYAGPHPVVAHPPCTRWCMLAKAVQGRYPEHRVGEDGGCFAAALESVRRWGGVLEHPAYTMAWSAHGLPDPPWSGWQRALCGGWVAHVEQAAYGHAARKATWLYANTAHLPDLRWDRCELGTRPLVSQMINRVNDGRRRLGKREANKTPIEFRDMLIAIARSARDPSPA